MNKRTTNNNQHNAVHQAPKGPVTCMTCYHALLHRYGNNPILSACMQQPQPGDKRFPYAVEVASCKRNCKLYQFTDVQKTVQIRIKAA